MLLDQKRLKARRQDCAAVVCEVVCELSLLLDNLEALHQNCSKLLH